ncbi:MAG: ATP-binding cassette domain-containing protein, partial [Pseudobdellovibrio sp.]
FYFNSLQMDMPARQLSGGELSRLILAKLMLKKAHVLILDEPTNDLDVETLEALSDCLDEFNGAVILVSHDRYFMDQNCDVIWALDNSNGLITTFADTYQWEDWFQQSKKAKSAPATSKNSNAKPSSGKSGLTNKEKIEFDKIEAVIAAEEARLTALNVELNLQETQSNFTKLNEITQQIATCEKNVETLFSRWEYLTEKSKES